MIETFSELETNQHLFSQRTRESRHDLGHILEVLYSAIYRPESWQTVLNLLCELAQCKHGFMISGDHHLSFTVRAQGEGRFSNTQLVDAYHQRYSNNDPFGQPILREGRIGVYSDDDLLPEEGLLRTDLYRQELRPRSLRYATVIVANASLPRIEFFSFWRTHNQGPISQESQSTFELLLPHIQKALELQYKLSASERRAAGAEAMLDTSAAATFLIKKNGRMIQCNAAARKLLSRGDALSFADGVITAFSSQSKEALRGLLEKASKILNGRSATIRYAIRLECSSGRASVNLLLVPLTSEDRERSKADFVIVVSDPEETVSYPAHVLQSLYGLSRAEAEVANGLVAGYSLDEIGKLRKVSTGTVRQQLKAIMARTGTQRQGELVSLLLRVPHCVDTK